jgi:hypothetical protein
LLHPLGDALLVELAAGLRKRLVVSTLLAEALPERPRTLGEPILLASQAPHRVASRLALSEPVELGVDLPLAIGQLTRFELQVAARAPPLVGSVGLQLPFDLAQTLERSPATFAGLRRILAAQIAGGISHFF